MEDSAGSGAEGRARKRLQKIPTENDDPLGRRLSTLSSGKGQGELKPNLSQRRRSIRDHKGPLGPRPLEVGPARRVFSDANAHGGARTNNPGSAGAHSQSFLPPSTSEPYFADLSAGSSSQFSFGSPKDGAREGNETTDSIEFLPSINFDDFHTSITSPAYQTLINDFPAPGRGGPGPPPPKPPADVPQGDRSLDMSLDAELSKGRASRASTLMRNLSNARRARNAAASNATGPEDTTKGLPTTSLPMRSRRQSQFSAPAPQNQAGRSPRKSVGPGLIPSALDLEDERLGRFALPPAGTKSILRTASVGKGGRRTTVAPSGAAPHVDESGVPPTARNLRTKSFQPPVNRAQGFLAGLATDINQQVSTPQSRSSGRSTSQRNQTPTSGSGKRQSILPAHASGLGARTISPTDARRLKRMSMLPGAGAGPQGPPTPQSETMNDAGPPLPSPSLANGGKTPTPSSARATPEFNQKSYGSGLSLSSSSSFNSLRGPANISIPKPGSALSTSRLPTPKPRSVHSSAGQVEDEVPPVPAIPKAYESPKDPNKEQFFPLLRKPVPQNNEPQLSASAMLDEPPPEDRPYFDGSMSEMAGGSQAKGKFVSRHRRGLTVGAGADAEKAPAVPHVNKRTLQPLRLPPLNLLPLSTPTAAKIASFPAPSQEVEQRRGVTTPPPKRGYAKTPSTPMTASKATFFSRNHDSEEEPFKLRSSSSHYQLRSESSTFHPAASSSAVQIPTARAGSRQITTPFASASLPKQSADFGNVIGRPSGEYKQSDASDVEVGAKPSGPRLLKKEPSSAATSTSEEPETPSSGSSIRRKLSLGWKRSSSKASHVSHPSQSNIPANKTEAQPGQPPKYSDMPPPRLPASATWTGPVSTSPSPTQKGRPSVEARRKPSAGNSYVSDTEAERRPFHRRQGSGINHAPPPYSEIAPGVPKSSASVFTPVQKMLGSKGSISTLKARNLDPNLDKDDLAADDEMKRLGAKRKEFEIAAKEVDDLRKRAKPQERVSPAQALQMVNLNIFERGEIVDYKDIYFCGTKSAKKHVGDLKAQTANFGYDDDRGDYNIVMGDHLAYRYEVVAILGKGSFGQVVRCVDHKTGGLVAVKIIRNKKRFHQQALVEVNILQKLREWDPESKHSMINFTQSFYFRGHLCISTELLGMNLYEFIKAHDFKGFSLRLIRRFTRQMLSSLVLLQGRRVIHCDLKPENILLTHPLHSEIKVIDFGSSCFENEKVYTYIQSRFYRSPEVILGMSYGLPIDMWSLGCILAELLTGYPIFPGENEQEQLACIMEVFGPPEKHLIEKSSRKKLFFDSLGKPRVTVSSKGRRRRPSSKTLDQALKCTDEAFLDFITRCLRWDPDKRMKPDEAIHHEFVTGIKRLPAIRSRPQPNGAFSNSAVVPSPVKRSNTQQTPLRNRPLPEPPVTSFKNGTAIPTSREASSASPIKPAGPPRRHSTVHNAQTNIGVKRASNGMAIGGANSALPRVTSRNASGKPDLASAAAIASLKKSR